MFVCDGFLYKLSGCGGFKKKTILVLGIGPTQGLENTLIAEKTVFN